MRRLLALGLVLSLGGCGQPEPAVSDFKLLTPRPFGYMNGDEIPHRLEFTTHNRVRLQQAGLPKPGNKNRWLVLKDIAVAETRHGDGYRYRIDLTYQLFYAPLEVKMLSVPGFELTLAQGANRASQQVPAWAFTVSPLRELYIRKDERGEYMRPDLQPAATVAEGAVTALYASLGLLVLSALWLGWHYGLLPGLPPRRAFAKAGKSLARLDHSRWGEALAVFHAALNQANDKPLFVGQLPLFCQRGYQPVAAELAWFFNCSERHFFANDPNPNAAADLARLRRLCARCAAMERNLS